MGAWQLSTSHALHRHNGGSCGAVNKTAIPTTLLSRRHDSQCVPTASQNNRLCADSSLFSLCIFGGSCWSNVFLCAGTPHPSTPLLRTTSAPVPHMSWFTSPHASSLTGPMPNFTLRLAPEAQSWSLNRHTSNNQGRYHWSLAVYSTAHGLAVGSQIA